VIYEFNVNKQQENQFISAWKDLTKMYHDYAGGLGSRLHKKSNQTYIAYAQWPDKNTWEISNSNLPEKANGTRKILRNTCKKVEVLYQLDVVEDCFY
jgi:hypothetical protein